MGPVSGSAGGNRRVRRAGRGARRACGHSPSGPPPLPVIAARRGWVQQIGALFEVTYVDETQPVTCVVLSVK
ncbi:hypothetical protein NUM_34470 [Actinocatenispora comari]|uniref:Uncharacterized protein n=1 Tax=Actinocatenispora comari TaxID=2807577 RepID=A0A8J4ELV5_9ACTN|nr:hypothetical protein NUM_34470 [Actinocatenispora comari]